MSTVVGIKGLVRLSFGFDGGKFYLPYVLGPCQVQALDLGSCDSTSMLVGYTKTVTEDTGDEVFGAQKLCGV
jgi:hypothetical protein